MNIDLHKKNLETVFVYDAENNRHKACIIECVQGHSPKFVKWIKPAKYHHLIPEFLRDEFTKRNGKLLRPVKVNGLPKEWYSKKAKEKT